MVVTVKRVGFGETDLRRRVSPKLAFLVEKSSVTRGLVRWVDPDGMVILSCWCQFRRNWPTGAL